jgi:nicotinate-nucleotide adenylyltransferase
LAGTAVFGGTFNPIHYGHLLLADDVRERLRLERVLFVPAGVPPHKSVAGLAPAADRYQMVKLATAGHPGFAVTDLELRRPGPSYTADTLQALHLPREALFLLVGSETFLDLLSWRTPRRLTELARIVIIPRAGSAFDPESAAALKVLREIGEDRFALVEGGAVPARGVLIVHALSLPVSASDLRARVREGRSIAFRLPDAVIAHIRAARLYRGEAP